VVNILTSYSEVVYRNLISEPGNVSDALDGRIHSLQANFRIAP